MPTVIGDLKLYSLKELSDTFKITLITLRSYLTSGKLKGQKMGTRWYVSEANLREYFKDTRQTQPEKKKRISLKGITSGSTVTEEDFKEAKKIWT